MNQENLYTYINKDGELECVDLLTGDLVPLTSYLPEVKTKGYLYSLPIAQKICQGIREGKTLKSICDHPDMPAYARLNLA